MSNIIKDNKEQQGETKPDTNLTSELITLTLAAILFAAILILQMISIASGQSF